MRLEEAALGEQVVLHLLHGVVLHEGDAPVAALVAIAVPFEECGAIVAQVQTDVTREVFLLGEIDVGVVRAIIWTELDVDGIRRNRRRTEVVVVVQEATCCSIAKGIAAACLIEEPDLSEGVVVLASALSICSVVREADVLIATAGDTHDVLTAQHVVDVSLAREVAQVAERYRAEHPVAVAA